MPNDLTSLNRRTLLTAALASITVAACGGGSQTPQEAVQRAANDATQSGVVGAVFGHLTSSERFRGVAGLARKAPKISLVGNEFMMIGSCTKAMTAMIAARLVERGAIGWNTAVGTALPELAASMLPDYQAVTLENLLAHRGGMLAFDQSADEDRFLAYLQGYPGAMPDTETGRRRLFCSWLLQQTPPAKVAPGQTYAYSNAGYGLVGAMLEAVTGKTYDTLFDEELFRPLGLSGHWGRPELLATNQPVGYEGDNKDHLVQIVPLPQEEEMWRQAALKPAGNDLAMTPAMFAGWLDWHLQALRGQKTPLPLGYIERLRNLAKGDYAMGWVGGTPTGSRKRVFHTGHIDGFKTLAEIYLDGAEANYGQTNTGSGSDPSDWVTSVMAQNLESMRG